MTVIVRPLTETLPPVPPAPPVQSETAWAGDVKPNRMATAASAWANHAAIREIRINRERRERSGVNIERL